MNGIQYLTQEKLDKLKQELQHMKSVERPAATQRLRADSERATSGFRSDEELPSDRAALVFAVHCDRSFPTGQRVRHGVDGTRPRSV